MEEIKAPKKERRFIKGLGEIALVLIRELVLGIGKKVINKVGNKREKLVIAIIILASSFAFAQYPATGNKQRLGYQTTGDGLIWRGRASDTVALKSSTINNAYHLFDTVNNVLFSYIKTKGGWKFNNADTIIINNNTDTTSLSSRINLKVNISDTASMLLKYLRKADTSLLNLNTRFAAKLNLLDTSSMLTNYLRSGVAASTYLTQSSAASTYLPLTGGTLTGGLTGTTANFVGNFGIGTNTPLNLLEVSKSNNGTSTSLRITNSFSETGSTDETADIDFYQGSSGGYFTSGRVRSFREGDYFSANTQITGGLSFWTQTSNAIPANGFTEKMRITSTGNVGIGTTTPQSTLEVHGSAVFNEGSGDFDTRIESDGNADMVFVDASTDRVGIGTNTPSSTLSVNGSVNASSLSLTNALPIASGGTNATSASGARNNLDVDYVFFATTAGTAVSLTSNRVFIVNTGSFSTTTLDLTPATSGRTYMVKNLASGTVVSGVSNVIPLNGGSPSTPILSAGNVTPQWCTLVCDGTNWHIIQRN